MAYDEDFNTSTPSDLEDVEDGASRIRELKRALNERLSTFFSNWPDGDPLEVEQDAAPAPVQLGTLAARPNPPVQGGLLYYTTDTEQAFLSLAGDPPLWTEINLSLRQTGIGNLSERPNPPATEGQLFYALDENKMYVSREVEGSPGIYEWITNATTQLVFKARKEISVEAAASPYDEGFHIDLPEGSWVIGYRARITTTDDELTEGWSSWVYQNGSTTYINAAIEHFTVEFDSVVQIEDTTGVILHLDVTTDAAAPVFVLIEVEVMVAAV